MTKTFGNLRYGMNANGVRAYLVEAQPDVMIRLKRIFPRANQRTTGQILLWDTPEVARDLEWAIDRWPLEMPPNLREHLTSRADEHRTTEQIVLEILSGERPPQELRDPARPARDYQTVAAELALATRSLLLGDDVGLGKTMSTLLVLRAADALPALVVTLTHLPAQWVEELELTLPWLVPHLIKKGSVYDPSVRLGREPDVLVTNYSKLRGWGEHLAGRIKTVIFDEIQELRHGGTAKYQAAAQIARGANYVVGATASPVYNYGGEIHNVMQIIRPDSLGSQEEFAREWCAGSWHDKVRVADPDALGVHLREQGLMLRRTRKEVGRELPETVRIPHTVETDDEVLDELLEGALDLASVIVSRQAPREELWRASGDFDWRMRHATGVAKAPYVAEFVKLLLESEERLVLFGWHRDVYDIWLDRLSDFSPLLFTGSETAPQKLRHQRAFMGGDARLLIMSLRAGAGLDGLQKAARVAVFGELDWSPKVHDQCIGRLARDGMGNDPVVAYFLLSEEGSDPVVAEVNQAKRMQSDPIMDPGQALFETAKDTENRVRLLAEDWLRRRGSVRPRS